MRPRITALLFGAFMPFVPCRRSRAETLISTILGSPGRMLHSKKVPRTSCAIRWVEGSGAGETAGAITAKQCSNGVRLAPKAYAQGEPLATPREPFYPARLTLALAPCGGTHR